MSDDETERLAARAVGEWRSWWCEDAIRFVDLPSGPLSLPVSRIPSRRVGWLRWLVDRIGPPRRPVEATNREEER